MSIPRPAPGTAKWWVIGVVGCLIGVGLAIWFGLSATLGQPSWTDLGYKVVDNRTVDVMYDVQRPAGAEVSCVLQALDKGFATVGTLEVTIPAGKSSTVRKTSRVQTTTRAVTGMVKICNVVQPASGQSPSDG